MQCPNCKYEPTLSQVQRSPVKCVSCGSDFRQSESGVAPSGPRAITGRYLRFGAIVALVVIGLIAAAVYGHRQYKESQLVEQVEQKMRSANSYVAEMLDAQAGRTNGEYLQKIPKRIEELDRLVADSLAIDDSAIPGASKLTADYVRVSRAYLNQFTRHLRATIQASVADAGYQSQAAYPSTAEGRAMLSTSAAALDARRTYDLNQIESEQDLMRKSDLLIASMEREKKIKRMGVYLDSRQEKESAEAAVLKEEKLLNAAGLKIRDVGNTVSDLLGKPMPVQGWAIP